MVMGGDGDSSSCKQEMEDMATLSIAWLRGILPGTREHWQEKIGGFSKGRSICIPDAFGKHLGKTSNPQLLKALLMAKEIQYT